ncbi:MAG: HD domain-containing protein [Nitrososphaera sp.]|nr:HD domain-containing protein [Nitrososphaera sp.]
MKILFPMRNQDAPVHRAELEIHNPPIKIGLDAGIELSNAVPLAQGGFKFAIRVSYRPKDQDARTGPREGVLKFLVPPPAGSHRTVLERFGKSREKFADEVRILHELNNHEGVESIEFKGVCSVQFEDEPPQDTPYFISKFVSDSQTLAQFCSDPKGIIGLRFLFSLMEKALTAIKACHEAQPRRLLHLDLHWGNILVVDAEADDEPLQRSCQKVVLIDFGNARRISPIGPEVEDYEHRRLTKVIGIHDFLHPDLSQYWTSGQPIPEGLLTSDHARRFDLFSLAEGFHKIHVGIHPDSDEKRSYDGLGQVIECLRNWGPEVTFDIDRAMRAIARTEEVWREPTLFRLSGGANVTLPMHFVHLVDCPEFQRLRGVYQLSLTHFIYPSATHSRFSHSLGAFDLCNRYIAALLANSPEFRSRFDDHELKALKIASLLHDVGHYPFAHYIEELWGKEVVRPRNLNINHAALGRDILESKLECRGVRLGRELQWWLCKILGEDAVQRIDKVWKTPVLREMVNGPIDCDKVDYLRRDGLACGVPYADSIDVARLLSSLAVVYNDVEQPGLGVSPKGLAPVESILNARYHLFSEVYWHKGGRGIAALVKHAFFIVATHVDPKESLNSQEFLDVMFAPNCSDWSVLEWLAGKLAKSGKTIEADALIRKPLLECNRGSLYKRLTTLCPIWDGESEESAYGCLPKRAETHDYARVVEIQNELIDMVNADLYRDNSPSKIAAHELLIDIPPAKDKRHDYPYIHYPEVTRGLHELILSKVSGVYNQARGTVSSLELTHKIRVFVARRHLERINEKWKTTQAHLLKSGPVHWEKLQ